MIAPSAPYLEEVLLKQSLRLLILASGIAVACQNGDLPSATYSHETESPAIVPSSASTAEELTGIARGLAMALANDDLAAKLRDLLRESPYNEHKILLAELLSSDEGVAILREASLRLGLQERYLSTLIPQLRPLDVYLPFREHRVSWLGTSNVMVGIVSDDEGFGALVYDGEGNSFHLRAQGELPHSPLIIMHPAEQRARRRNIRAFEGGTVQDPFEKDETEARVLGPEDAARDRSIGLHQMCTPENEWCGGTGGGTPLRHIVETLELFDHFEGPFLGSMEIELHYLNSNDEVVEVRKEGVEVDNIYTLNAEVRSNYPFDPNFLTVETDGWGNQDDIVGWGTLRSGLTSIVCDDDGGLSECEAAVRHL